MDLGWKALIPLALGWLLLLAVIQVFRDRGWGSPEIALPIGVAFVVMLLGYALLLRAISTAQREHEASGGVEVFD
jgi:hypothetical protein